MCCEGVGWHCCDCVLHGAPHLGHKSRVFVEIVSSREAAYQDVASVFSIVTAVCDKVQQGPASLCVRKIGRGTQSAAPRSFGALGAENGAYFTRKYLKVHVLQNALRALRPIVITVNTPTQSRKHALTPMCERIALERHAVHSSMVKCSAQICVPVKVALTAPSL
jgi:hypothetical protein